jgi:hypothetical protein
VGGPAGLAPGRAFIGLHWSEEGLRSALAARAHMAAAQWSDPEADPAAGPPPLRLGAYHSLYPLEEGALGPGGQLGPPPGMPPSAVRPGGGAWEGRGAGPWCSWGRAGLDKGRRPFRDEQAFQG